VIPVPNSQHVSSGGLALVVHGLFFVALLFGLSWKTLPQIPVEADMWQSLPSLPPPPPPVVQEPEPAVTPPVAEKPAEADIALEKAKKIKLAEARREAREKAQAMKERLNQERLERDKAERARMEKEKAELARLEKERALRDQQEKDRLEKEKREAIKRQFEQVLNREMHDQMTAESPQVSAVQARINARTIKDFRDRIIGKIRGNVRLPPTIAGNPQAEFQVSLLPNGEVLRVTLTKSSGQKPYDQEVERAILKSSPLPLPADKSVAAVFRDGLALKFRPFD